MDPGTTMVAGFAIWLTFVAVMAVVRTVTKVSMARSTPGVKENSGSIAGSELRKLITDAVSDATDPLHERMGRLERKVDALQLQAATHDHAPRPEIEIPADDEYGALEEAVALRRSRA